MKPLLNFPSAALAILVLVASAAHAQNYTWTGGTNNWSDAASWDTPPVGTGNSTTRLIFNFNGNSTTSTNNLGNFTLNRLTFNSTFSTSIVFGNATNALIFVNDGATDPEIVQSSTAAAVGAQVSNPISLTGVDLLLSGNTMPLTLNGAISGNGSITLPIGTWVLSSGASTFSGGIDVTGATSQLIFAGNSTGAAGAVTQGPAGTGKISLQQGILRTTNSGNFTVNNDMDIAGNVQFGSTSPDTSMLTVGGATNLTGNTTRTITLSASTATGRPVVLAGAIAGTGSASALTVAGTGTLELSGAAANTYTGNTTVNSSTATLLLNKTAGVNAVAGNLTLTSGTIRLGQSNQIADTSALNLTAGTFDLNGHSETINTLVNSVSSGTITSSVAGNSTLTIAGTTGGDTNISITNGNGTVSLVKNGASTLILRGASTYSGGTTLNNGQIALVNTSSLGTGTITLNGGVLRTQDTTAQNFSNNLEIGGNVQLGLGSTNATMTFNGTTTILGTGATHTVNILSGTGTNRTPVTFAGAIGDGGNANGLTFSSTSTSVGTGNFTTAQFGSGAADTAANTYTGLTTVSAAQTRLLLNKADGTNAIAGNLTQTDGLVVLARSNQIANSSTVSVNGGTFDLGGNSETITALNVGATLSPQVANGTLTTSGGTNTISNASGNVTISANLAGTNDLVKTGLGIVFLSGNNSYSGGTLIQEGSTTTNIGFGSSTYGVVLQANNALGTGPLTIGNATTTNARLALNGYNQTVSALSSGSVGTLVIEANGTGGGALSTLTVDQATDTTYSGFLRNNNTTSGQLALVKTGSGTLTFDGVDKSYTGGTTISAGTLQIGAGGGTGSIASPTIVNNSALVVDRTGSLTLSGNMSGSGTLTKNGAGNLTLSGTNSFTGGTTINAGTLSLAGTQHGNNTISGNILVNSGALLQYGAARDNLFANTSNVTIAGGTFAVGARTETIGGLTITSGALTLGSGTLTINGTSAFSGGTVNITATAGRINTNGAVTLGSTTFLYDNASNASNSNGLNVSNITVSDGATAAFANALGGIGRIELTANSTITVGTGASLNVDWLVDEFGSARGLTKSGEGTLTLSAANTYTGGTTLSGGLITMNASGALGTTGNITFSGGGLQFSANGTTDVSSRIKNSTSAVLLNTNAQNITFGSAIDGTNIGGLTKNGTGTLVLSGSNAYTGTTTLNLGNLTLQSSNALGTSTLTQSQRRLAVDHRHHRHAHKHHEPLQCARPPERHAQRRDHRQQRHIRCRRRRHAHPFRRSRRHRRCHQERHRQPRPQRLKHLQREPPSSTPESSKPPTPTPSAAPPASPSTAAPCWSAPMTPSTASASRSTKPSWATPAPRKPPSPSTACIPTPAGKRAHSRSARIPSSTSAPAAWKSTSPPSPTSTATSSTSSTGRATRSGAAAPAAARTSSMWTPA
jgi:fibronectin-binding autotransporter adhesin